MMKRFGVLIVLAVGIFLAGMVARPAMAQQGEVWIQIEAHPDLATAETRVRAYSRLVENVNGFSLSNGWYAVALGPYPRDAAEARLRSLRAQGLVPRDSYIEIGRIYRQQFFPIGGVQPASTTETAEPEPVIEIIPAEETLAEARAAERTLDRAERETLQVALQWFGFYNSGIDGAFGPGTRRAMEAWQIAKGFEATGVLTTAQRATLLDDYRTDQAALGLQQVVDTRAGIEITLPMGLIAFDRYEFPFVQYGERDGSGVRALLISQPGTRATLGGLYEIMQTLEIVPLEGERRRRADSFVLTGQSETLRSHTVARLEDGAIKGFTLIWTPENDAQMARVLPIVEASLRSLPGALDPGAVDPGTMQGEDLVAGLEVRRPEMVRTGFYADAAGTVVTTSQVVDGCTRVLIDGLYEAETAYVDAEAGVAVLRPVQSLAPLAHATLTPAPARVRAQVAVAGFPFEGALPNASLGRGEVEGLTGLDGDARLQRLAVATNPSEAGAPVLDSTGSVLGMIVPVEADGRSLPEGVSFSLAASEIAGALEAAGLAPVAEIAAATPAELGHEALARLGADLAVLVTCWN